MGLWGRAAPPSQRAPSPQEMSHSRVGAPATSASAAGASGGEQVPATTPTCRCPSPPPRMHRIMPAGPLVCTRTYMPAPPHTHTHPESASGLWGEPSSQTAGCPVWEPGLSLLLTKPGVEGTKQEGAGFRPQGPPTSYRAVGSLLTRLYPGEPGPPRLR